MNRARTQKFYEIFIPALAGLYTGHFIFYLRAEMRALKYASLAEMKKMTAQAITNITGNVLAIQADDRLICSKRQWSAGFLVSGSLGMLSGISGIVINALFLLDMAENKATLSLAGTWLLVVAFPLLFLGAHCLDRIDKVERAIRAEYCRGHGLEDHECCSGGR